MRLNTLKPAVGSRKERDRVGRGISAGGGKTAGRGHKGQHSRSGGYTKVGFEGGQMPLQRRVPKSGFRSRKSMVTAEVRLSELKYVDGGVVDLDSLKKADVIPMRARAAKIIESGSVEQAVTVKGVRVSKGARAAIEKAGGSVDA
ncbi:50S ribosomal protein L15 [Aquisalimonas asiatica]|uniref:Large ribosomal subunit protein uL15 n=1 Tax=Aquisalimonas asiatica TaxID=406100 RepID=A0A1H8USJ4_9GAMM|nr:50S ribosomal protein L15 [Aquisalimonas asiatica]SEP06159.1 LSU ribosomal protein L15P [Aquisalimonas asiatica]